MLSALSLTLVMGVNPTPITTLQKPVTVQCPAKVAGNIQKPAPSAAKTGKMILVNAQILRLNVKSTGICPIPLAGPKAKP